MFLFKVRNLMIKFFVVDQNVETQTIYRSPPYSFISETLSYAMFTFATPISFFFLQLRLERHIKACHRSLERVECVRDKVT
ncbi:F22G5.21 [Arabidopsis thaliana]|uniref:F22G5.21 n=1 Tax=Arabidopsis thaliana TaxID=3702 RepID=Q9LNW4_ARATH|nr:F22G5.21 [Arabidopsis thaliana]